MSHAQHPGSEQKGAQKLTIEGLETKPPPPPRSRQKELPFKSTLLVAGGFVSDAPFQQRAGARAALGCRDHALVEQTNTLYSFC